MTVETSDFINGCHNVVWLSGYARRTEDGTVLLSQSDNDARAIPIQMGSTLRCPPPNEAFEVKCHLYSEHGEDGSSRVWLEAYYIRRASVRAVPKLRALLNGLRRRGAVADRPFASREDILAELQEQQALTREAVEALLPSERKAGRDQFVNRVHLSGFLGNRRFIPPAEGSWDDFGALMFELRQGDDPKQAARIIIPNAGMKFSGILGKPLWPLVVEARLRVDSRVNDAGEITDRTLSLETTVNHIHAGTLGQFAGKEFPGWWKALANAGGTGTTAPSAAPAAHAAVPAATPPLNPPVMDRKTETKAPLAPLDDEPLETW